MGEQECGRVRERIGRVWESERVWEKERDCGEREWGGGNQRERESVGEQERMWERTENVGTDLDLSLHCVPCLFV